MAAVPYHLALVLAFSSPLLPCMSNAHSTGSMIHRALEYELKVMPEIRGHHTHELLRLWFYTL